MKIKYKRDLSIILMDVQDLGHWWRAGTHVFIWIIQEEKLSKEYSNVHIELPMSTLTFC